ncbi:MAG: hypothetical protein ABIG39_01495 [Candidatus Micrarchaeota archaeon]
MEQHTMEEIISEAKRLTGGKIQWHFHMLGTDCIFNQHKGKFTMILENEESGEIQFSLSEKKPLKEAKELADMLYGKGFLEEKGDDGNQDFLLLFKRAQELTNKKISWHHHHLHPNCTFSKHKGKHCIVLEDPVTCETLTAIYERKPISDLAKIEKLFYREL